MQMLSRMNAKLNVGWKMTNLSCPKCCGTTLAEPSKQIKTLYCPKEDKLYPYEPSQEQDQQSSSEQEEIKSHSIKKPAKEIQISNVVAKSAKQQDAYDDDNFYLDKKSLQALEKTNDVSKLIGQKLLQGWTMLNESCETCYSPIMKSKKQEKICFGCNKNYTKPVEKKIKEQVKVQVSPSKPKLQQKQIVNSSITPNIPKTHLVPQDSTKSAILQRIHTKSLLFIEGKIDKAIEDNDLVSLQRALSLISQIRSAFN